MPSFANLIRGQFINLEALAAIEAAEASSDGHNFSPQILLTSMVTTEFFFTPTFVTPIHEHPVVPPHVLHFKHVPFRTSVKFPHSPQASPS